DVEPGRTLAGASASRHQGPTAGLRPWLGDSCGRQTHRAGRGRQAGVVQLKPARAAGDLLVPGCAAPFSLLGGAGPLWESALSAQRRSTAVLQHREVKAERNIRA